MYFQYDITTLNEFGRRSSPTEAMFSDWGQKNHTILELFQSLSKMQHYRCMKILLPLGNGVVVKYFVINIAKDIITFSI